jgi:hypothetical protein
MNKKNGLMLLLIGAAVVAGAAFNVFGMSSRVTMEFDRGFAIYSSWPFARQAMLAGGVIVALLGLGMFALHGRKQKK